MRIARWAGKAWVVMAVLGVAAIAVYYLLPTAGVAQAVLLAVLNAGAAACTLRTAAQAHGRERVVWGSFGTAVAFSALANVPYYGWPLLTGHALPFPSPVDGLWLATYPCYMVALVAMAGQRRRGDWRGDLLDAAIMVVGASALMWVFIIAPVVHASGLALLAHVVAVGYPAMDLLVFAVLIRLVIAVSWRSGSMRLLVLSMVILMAADMLYAVELANGSYHVGGPTDALWMGSYLLVAVAALHPASREFARQRRAQGGRLSRGRMAFLTGSVLTGPVLLATRPKELVVVACASIVSFLLVMVRMTGLNRQLVSASAELESRATTDSLTGLANRAAFHDGLHAALSRPEPRGGTQAVLFLDLDDFKDVNDTLGHAAGDTLLRIVADRLRATVRPGDLIARLGGDEFAVLLDALPDPADALVVAERAAVALAATAEINGITVQAGASIGLALRQHDSDPDSLMRQADIAMYAGKGKGKNRVERYDPVIAQALNDHHALKADIVGAAGRGELVVDYQPLVDLASGTVVGVEALVRWQHPDRGLLPPSSFIGLAEETGAIVDLGDWVLQTAAQQMQSWQRRYARPDLYVSVNVSVCQLDEPGFRDRVESTLSRTGLSPQCLVLEVTESVLLDPRGGATACLEALRRLGVRVAIDDFGTGYSSIGYLRQLPVDILKIDRSFVSGEHGGPQGEALLEAIVGLAQHLSLDVIPEGIEEESQLILLQALGCRTGQGFLLSRPVPTHAIDTMLAHRQPAEAFEATDSAQVPAPRHSHAGPRTYAAGPRRP